MDAVQYLSFKQGVCFVKRIMVTIISFIATAILLSSCTLKAITMRNNLIGGDRQVANENFAKVINAIQMRDINTLRNLFSKKTISCFEDFESEITALCDYYQGEMISYNDWSGPQIDMKKEDGCYQKSLKSSYDVNTDKGNYRFAIQLYSVDTFDKNNVGIYSLYIVNANHSDCQFAYAGDGQWTSGIHIGLNIAD